MTKPPNRVVEDARRRANRAPDIKALLEEAAKALQHEGELSRRVYSDLINRLRAAARS